MKCDDGQQCLAQPKPAHPCNAVHIAGASGMLPLLSDGTTMAMGYQCQAMMAVAPVPLAGHIQTVNSL